MILKAVELTIADVEAENGPDRDENIAFLFQLRARLANEHTDDASKEQ